MDPCVARQWRRIPSPGNTIATESLAQVAVAQRNIVVQTVRTEGAAPMPDQNFIGGSWRDARDGATDEVLNPATGEVLAKVAGERRRRRRRRGRGRGRRVRRVGDDDAAGPQRDAAQGRRRDRGRPRHHQATSRCRTCGKPALDHRVRDGPHASTTGASSPAAPASSRAAPRASTSRSTRRYVRRDPLGVVGVDRAVELPAQHGDVEARPRARGRQHGRAQAVGAHAAAARCASPRSPPTSSRPACSTSSPARARPRATRSCATRRSRWCRSPASVETGKLIARTAAETLKRVHLELGGKAPVVDLRRRRRRGARSRR